MLAAGEGDGCGGGSSTTALQVALAWECGFASICRFNPHFWHPNTEKSFSSTLYNGGDLPEPTNQDDSRWFQLLMAVCVFLAIALPLSLGVGGRKGANSSSKDTKGSFDAANCLPGDVDARYELTKNIITNITLFEMLEDGSTFQGSAIR